MPPDRVFAAIKLVAAAAPRTFSAVEYGDRHQIHYVVRSSMWNFPDLVTVSVGGPDSGPSTLVIYSRSVYGHSDLGANRARVAAWLAALQTMIER
jgi:uncharacterized protein (DUF1499 family)